MIQDYIVIINGDLSIGDYACDIISVDEER